MSKLIAVRIPDELFVEMRKVGDNVSQVVIIALERMLRPVQVGAVIYARQPEAEPVKEKKSKAPTTASGLAVDCPRCGGKLARWTATMDRCHNCSANYLRRA